MPDKSSEQEPSIEEILASIRQIIADDDEEPAKAPAPAAPEPVVEPVRDDVLELTEVIRDNHEDDIIVDLREHEEPPEPVAEPEPTPPPVYQQPASTSHDESILTDQAASAALQGFARLASRTPVERSSHMAGITLEDIVRDLMRPMLRDWLDQNLPPLIEKLVVKELQHLAGQVRKDD